MKFYISTILLLFLSTLTFGATFSVTRSDDRNGNCSPGDCSLREAITAANTAASDDTITFAANLTRITLIKELTVGGSGTLTINGTGANNLEVGRFNQPVFNPLRFRIFNVSGVATITNLKISGGQPDIGDGNGILNNGNLTIINCVVSENNGDFGNGAISNTGTITILNSTVINNKSRIVGGILNTGTLYITNSTVSNNAATDPTSINVGGISSSGAAYITGSTISFNTSENQNYFPTGGVSNAGTLFLTNSTVSSNMTANISTAVSGIRGGAIVTNSTIAYNSGVSITGGRFRNTIVAGSTGGAGMVQGDYTSLGNNIIGIDPRIAPLANNGGATLTHALLSGSPAIDAGNNCVLTASCASDNPPQSLTTDQRGSARAADGNGDRVITVDIGAVESPSVGSPARPSFDFDGDRKSDLSVFRPSNGGWYVLPSQNNAFYGFPFGQAGDQIVPADYDGDGKTDAAVFRETVSGAGNQSYFYILNSSNNTFRAEQFGTQGDQPVISDRDGDGKADLAVYRGNNTIGSQSRFFYRLSSQPNVDFYTQTNGTGGRPIIGDFDGDGKIDYALFAPSARWSILRSSDSQILEVTFGLQDDVPVPADYDGDGITNIAVFRPSNGTWYTSTNPQNNYGAIQFGASGDLPVAADYDGDGRADVAVWRPSNGAWYMQRSSNGFLGVQFGASGDRPIPNAYVR